MQKKNTGYKVHSTCFVFFPKVPKAVTLIIRCLVASRVKSRLVIIKKDSGVGRCAPFFFSFFFLL